MITTVQIKKIHTLKNAIGLSDEKYRKQLQSFGVGSSKDLTKTEAKIFIQILEREQKLRKRKFDELQGRDSSMATPMQLRKLEAVWVALYQKQTTLREFLHVHFKVSDIKFLTKHRAIQIIGVLEKTRLKKALKAV